MNNSIKLIDGTYKVEDAGEILLSVLGDKIRFHNINSLGSIERACDDSYNSDVRLKELNADRERVLELLKNNKSENKQIKINCKIEIEVVESAEAN